MEGSSFRPLASLERRIIDEEPGKVLEADFRDEFWGIWSQRVHKGWVGGWERCQAVSQMLMEGTG